MFVQFDSARLLSRKAIAALFALDGAAIIALGVLTSEDPATQAALSAAAMLGSWALWYTVIALLTYLARSRQPFDPGPDDERGPAPWGPLRAS